MAPNSRTSGWYPDTKPGELSLHEGADVPVLQTISQAWPIDPLPHFTVLELGVGGLHDGKFSGSP
jgi:hypothetical protein